MIFFLIPSIVIKLCVSWRNLEGVFLFCFFFFPWETLDLQGVGEIEAERLDCIITRRENWVPFFFLFSSDILHGLTLAGFRDPMRSAVVPFGKWEFWTFFFCH